MSGVTVTAPKMPVAMTSAAISVGMPPFCSARLMAIGAVADFVQARRNDGRRHRAIDTSKMRRRSVGTLFLRVRNRRDKAPICLLQSQAAALCLTYLKTAAALATAEQNLSQNYSGRSRGERRESYNLARQRRHSLRERA